MPRKRRENSNASPGQRLVMSCPCSTTNVFFTSQGVALSVCRRNTIPPSATETNGAANPTPHVSHEPLPVKGDGATIEAPTRSKGSDNL